MVIAHRASNDQLSQLRDTFQEIDTANEGYITLEELRKVLTDYHIDDDEITKIFDGMDIDQTGKISYTEFLAATVEVMGLSREESLLEAFDRLDSDDSGFITKDNLKEILGSAYKPVDVDRMIDEADFKQNGKVDQDEFLQMMRSEHQ